jgi:SAM-dependent methyltransferase
MWKYRAVFTWNVIEQETKRTIKGKKAPMTVPRTKETTEWNPSKFELERTTVWSFPKRGNWAVHSSDYRGNWPPQLPRNLIMKYSKKNDIVLDPFVGGGTTLIEAYLLRRRSIGIDINPLAIRLSNKRIRELEQRSEKAGKRLSRRCRPVVKKGDARNSSKILLGLGHGSNSVDLVCAHPPYLDALRYTEDINRDLSHISNTEMFCTEIQKIAGEIHKVLKDQGRCAILVGDVRKEGRIVSLGFELLNRFLAERFQLEEIIIKEQHGDRSTEFYLNKDSVDYLIAHEYLFVFRKARKERTRDVK